MPGSHSKKRSRSKSFTAAADRHAKKRKKSKRKGPKTNNHAKTRSRRSDAFWG